MNEEQDGFDDFLREMMQEAGPEKAPANFTSAVMGQIAAEQAVAAKRRWRPVITWKGWVAAAMVIAAIFGVAWLLPSSPSAPTEAQLAAEGAVNSAVQTLGHLQVPILLALTAGAVFLLFALDRWLSSRAS